jgi:hypothetical protein
MKSVVGILITDDGVDLAANEVAEIEWMKKNTPGLWPWVNQCGDGSEWLARAGTPYLVPELYSVKGPGGNATQMCQGQLSGYDSWGAKGSRFNLTLFPLINVGDGGDTGLVRTNSLTRFQAYSALAYGSKGLMWYCWGRGIWNFTTTSPTPIYPTVKEVNQQALSWGQTLLKYDSFEGVYNTGWAIPKYSAWAPTATQIITKMGDNLLAGVMTAQSQTAVLVLVVDKRVTSQPGSGDNEARNVSVTFSSGLVSSVKQVDGDSEKNVHIDGLSITAALKPGAGALLVVESVAAQPNALQLAAYALRRRRYPVTAAPSLGSIQTTQYQYYNSYYKNRPFADTNFIVGATSSNSSLPFQSTVTELAEAGFNIISASSLAPSFSSILNEGLRQGVMVLSSVTLGDGGPGSDVSKLSSLRRDYACHPNFAGFNLYCGKIEEDECAENYQGASTWMQHDTSDLFGITSPAADASNVVALSKANVPMVPMELPTAGIDGDSMIIGKLANLSFAWLGGSGFDGAMLTEISISSVSPGAYIRLAAYASVAFGAQGLLFNCARASADQYDAVRKINVDVHRWGNSLAKLRMSGVLNSGGAAIPHTSRLNESAGFNQIVTAIDEDVLVAFLVGYPDPDAAPPALMVVDKRVAGARRTVSVELGGSYAPGSTVKGWSPLVGDCSAGFGSCAKAVLGNKLELELEPGQGVLTAITLSKPGGSSEEMQGRWTRKGGPETVDQKRWTV